jgi:cell division protein FtsN
MTTPRSAPATGQRGSFALGLVVGVLLGLAVSLAVALWITRAPIPFINKVPQRTAEQDVAEAERNRNWDPNAALANRPGPRVPGAPQADAGASAPAAGAPGATGTPGTPGTAARDPAAILAGGATPGTAPAAPAAGKPAPTMVYFVQAGAFTRPEEAEQQRAKLALMGLEARIDERAVSGRTLLRVRLGPHATRDAAEAQQQRLKDAGVDATIALAEKQP